MTSSRPGTLTPTDRPTAPTMKAIVQRAYGAPEVLRLDDVPRPTITDQEVLVRVRAASVNHADGVYTAGRPLAARLAFGLRAPRTRIRGKDLAGEVAAVGAAVTGIRVGDEVYAEVEAGSFAEYARVPESRLAHKPATLSFEQAAAVPLAGGTALQGLRDAGTLQAGQKVLITGAAGGVGSFAVQIARALGAEVTGVCSSRNAEFVRGLGADHVLDYGVDDFTARGERYDLIFDLVGTHSLTALRRALTPTGRLVLSSGTGGPVFGPMGRVVRAQLMSPFVGQTLVPFVAAPSGENLGRLRELIDAGAVTPAIDRRYALGDVPAAMRAFAEESLRGKIVITM